MTTSNERDYFVLWFRLDRKDRYTLWFSDDEDGFWTKDGQVLAWQSETAVRAYAARHAVVLKDEIPKLYDLDQIVAFAEGGKELDPSLGLDAWNLFVDAATSVKDSDFSSLEQDYLAVYNHLFFLSGAMPVAGESPPPLTSAEAAAARKVFSLGLAMLRNHVLVMTESN